MVTKRRKRAKRNVGGRPPKMGKTFDARVNVRLHRADYEALGQLAKARGYTGGTVEFARAVLLDVLHRPIEGELPYNQESIVEITNTVTIAGQGTTPAEPEQEAGADAPKKP